MATIFVRGREIDVNSKPGTQREAYIRLYESYSNERLDELQAECFKERARRQAKWKTSRG